MKLSKARRDNSIAFNMTPMIDIVFLLIIFFMTVSQITRTVDHPVELPVVQQGSDQTKPSSITINLDDKGSIVVGGRELKFEDAIAAVDNQLAAKNFDTSLIKIQIRCDRDCESRFVNRLVQRLSEIGFTQVRVAVAEK